MEESRQPDFAALVETARTCRAAAYAPYSRYQVGAALLTETGEVFGGCNVENASYGLTICAERTAITSAVAAGHRSFKAIAIVTSDSRLPSPCGACRQFMVEFSPNMRVILANDGGQSRTHAAKDLLPDFFTLKE